MFLAQGGGGSMSTYHLMGTQTAFAVSCAGECVGENNNSTIGSIVSAKVLREKFWRQVTKFYHGHIPVQI